MRTRILVGASVALVVLMGVLVSPAVAERQNPNTVQDISAVPTEAETDADGAAVAVGDVIERARQLRGEDRTASVLAVGRLRRLILRALLGDDFVPPSPVRPWNPFFPPNPVRPRNPFRPPNPVLPPDQG